IRKLLCWDESSQSIISKCCLNMFRDIRKEFEENKLDDIIDWNKNISYVKDNLMNHKKHIELNKPLNIYEMLSLYLYTSCSTFSYEFRKSCRENQSCKWASIAYYIHEAIEKLSILDSLLQFMNENQDYFYLYHVISGKNFSLHNYDNYNKSITPIMMFDFGT